MREMYRKLMLQVKGSYKGQTQDGDHADGHYITLFAEQLTRTFEVLVRPRTLPENILKLTVGFLVKFS